MPAKTFATPACRPLAILMCTGAGCRVTLLLLAQGQGKISVYFHHVLHVQGPYPLAAHTLP
jgi:hypothetical protein